MIVFDKIRVASIKSITNFIFWEDDYLGQRT